MKGYPPSYTLRQVVKDLEAKMNWNEDDEKEDTPYCHLCIRFKDISMIYPIDKPRAKVKAEEIDMEKDKDRWVEIPDDYLKTTLNYSEDSTLTIVVEYKQQEDDSWPRAKGDDWRETLQTGDI